MDGAAGRAGSQPLRIPVAAGVALHVERWPGDPARTPFLLVHGLASNLRLWDEVAGRLAAAGHPVVALDQRGHGQSDAPEGGYDLDTAVADARTVSEALELDRPVVVGQSWGGNVVLELGWRHPGSVRGVVGVDGGLIELAEAYPSWEACLEALTPPALAGLPLETLTARIRTIQAGWPPAALDAALANFRVRTDGTVEPRLSRERHLSILRSAFDHRPSSRLATLAVPALFLLVEGDDPARTEHKRRAAARAVTLSPRVRVHWIPGAHHDVHAQRPERVAGLLRQGLNEDFSG